MLLYYILLFIAILVLIFSVIVLFFLCWSMASIFITKVPWAPTPKKVIEATLTELNLKPGQIVYDLGCGDARFLLAAEKFGVKTIGYECSLSPWLSAQIKIFLNRVKTKVYLQNFYKVDLSQADVIFCFLIDKAMPRLEEKLQKELKPGTKVVSYAFPFPNWQPEKILKVDLGKRLTKVYFYDKLH